LRKVWGGKIKIAFSTSKISVVPLIDFLVRSQLFYHILGEFINHLPEEKPVFSAPLLL
jgi:hypothetical protein